MFEAITNPKITIAIEYTMYCNFLLTNLKRNIGMTVTVTLYRIMAAGLSRLMIGFSSVNPGLFLSKRVVTKSPILRMINNAVKYFIFHRPFTDISISSLSRGNSL